MTGLLARVTCLLGLCLLAPSLTGCRERAEVEKAKAVVALGPSVRTLPAERPSVRLLDQTERAELDHGGLVLELGEEGSETGGDFSLAPEAPWPRVTHAGATYARLDQRHASFSFWLGTPLAVSSISALVRAGGTDRAVVSIDERRVTTLRAGPEPEVTLSKIPSLLLAPGPHRISFQLPGRADLPRSLDVSWLRLGSDGTDPADLPPARKDVVREVEIGGDQRPAVVLRSGGALRFPLWIPEGARLKTAIGLWGAGSASAELSVIAGGQRTVLASHRIEKSEEVPRWHPLELDLAPYAGRAATLELHAVDVTSGARLAFADPELVLAELPMATVPRAKRAIVIVLAGLLREHRPASLAQFGLPSLAAFSRSAAFYPEYRNPTTSTLGVVASLLTGLEPWQHRMAEDTDRLPLSRPTLAETLAASGGDAGFFTGVPLSFEGFGLNRGFERYVSISPTEDRAATDPIDEAQAWLAGHQAHTGPLLSVVHLRAGHPPFDIDRDRARGLPPKEYGGDLDARRAAIQLAEIRARRPAARRQMPEEDWLRLESLRRTALLDLDARLSRFFTWLSSTFPDDGTLIVVMGDVPAGERPHVPYEDHAELTEEYLRSLLLLRHPGGQLAAQAIPGVYTTTDLTHTLAMSLGVELVTKLPAAIDLGDAHAPAKAGRRLQIAYRDGAYSALRGPLLLIGRDGHAPRLCDLRLDPSCLDDRRERELPLLRAMWDALEDRLGPDLLQKPTVESREPDERLDHALVVWGVEH